MCAIKSFWFVLMCIGLIGCGPYSFVLKNSTESLLTNCAIEYEGHSEQYGYLSSETTADNEVVAPEKGPFRVSWTYETTGENHSVLVPGTVIAHSRKAGRAGILFRILRDNSVAVRGFDRPAGYLTDRPEMELVFREEQ
jgi:hypothetical protein